MSLKSQRMTRSYLPNKKKKCWKKIHDRRMAKAINNKYSEEKLIAKEKETQVEIG